MKVGQVQKSFVPVRECGEDSLMLGTPTRPEVCAVLEVLGINYTLKSSEEQQLTNDVFRVLLASLSYPLQILLRIQPFALESYLAHFHPAPHTQEKWATLAHEYQTFLEHYSEHHTLMQRRFYIVVPSMQTEEATASYLHQFWPARRQEEQLTAAYDRLQIRCQGLTRQLVAMGLAVRRLQRAELIELEYSMLTHARSRRNPLLSEWIDNEGHPLLQHQEPPKSLPFLFKEEKTTPGGPARKQHVHRRRGRGQDDLYGPTLADLLAPAGVQITRDMLFVDSEWIQILDVVSFPRRVSAGWLNRLATLDVPVDLCLYYHPVASDIALRRLQRTRFETATTNLGNVQKGKLHAQSQVIQSDVEDLMTRIAAGKDRLLECSFSVLIRGETRREVAHRAAQVRTFLAGMLLQCRPCLFEQAQAFRSFLPHGRDELRATRVPLAMGAHEASSTFPFHTHTLLNQKGILEGITLQGNEPVINEWWSPRQHNANRLIVAPSGAGKSFKAKLDTIRAHLWYARHGTSDALRYQTLIVDLSREYRRVTELLDGQWIRMASGTNHYLNPFDLPARPNHGEYTEDVLAEKIVHLHALLDIMLADRQEQDTSGSLSNSEKGLLDQALFACYERKGITRDPATHHLEPPLLADLYAILCEEAETKSLAQRLHRFVSGSLAGLFTGHTTITLEAKPVVCFDIRDMPEQWRPIALFLISTYVWNLSHANPMPRQFIIDELLTLYEYEEGKQFLEALFQRARKHSLSVVGIVQDPKRLLDSTIPTNCATAIVMKQEAPSLPLVSAIFHLSETEISLVSSFKRGEALLLIGDARFAARFEASSGEYTYCATDPVAMEGEPPGAAARDTRHLVEQ